MMIWKRTAAFLTVVSLLSLCWTAAYMITDLLFNYLHITWHALPVQLINSLLGFFFFGLSLFLAGRFFKNGRKKQIEFLQSITDAMQQIARGNFNVNLRNFPDHENAHHPFGKIVDNINYMAKELGEMEQMRQEFVSNVSHEIQSPLTSISGFARALRNDTLDHDARLHYLSIIETESQRLSKISDNLLKLTYLESSQPPFELETYRLDKQLQQIVLSSEPQWMEKKIEMDFSLRETMITADKELLDQVWLNLLSNAIKFTPDGGTISLQICRINGKLTVKLSDSGIGIAEENRLHLFERFYKVDKARSRNKSGSGLGLSIVKKIIDMHHGTIRVKSKQHEGTTFIITFDGEDPNKELQLYGK